MLRFALAATVAGLVASAPAGASARITPSPALQGPELGPDATAASEPQQPNILVIVLDDAGFEDMQPAVMPVLNAFAAYGRLYTRLYTGPTCSPSRYMLNTGRYPHREFIGGTIVPNDPVFEGLSTRTLTVAEVLKGSGYATALFGKWHLSTSAGGEVVEMPRVHGYEQWLAGAPTNLTTNLESHYSWTRTDNGIESHETTYSTRAIADSLRDWWTATEGPKFGMCCYLAPHAPFESAVPSGMLPPNYIPPVDGLRGDYLSALSAIDLALLELIQFVDLPNTYIIITSDNGTPLNVEPPFAIEKGYKSTPYEGGTNVPLVVFGPSVAPGVDATSLISMCDLPLTLIELAGLDAPRRGFEDAVSFAPTIEGTETSARTIAWSHLFFPSGGLPGAAYVDDWCVVRSDGTKLVSYGEHVELFDLSLDPHEQTALDPLALWNVPIVVEMLAEREAILGSAWPY